MWGNGDHYYDAGRGDVRSRGRLAIKRPMNTHWYSGRACAWMAVVAMVVVPLPTTAAAKTMLMMMQWRRSGRKPALRKVFRIGGEGPFKKRTAAMHPWEILLLLRTSCTANKHITPNYQAFSLRRDGTHVQRLSHHQCPHPPTHPPGQWWGYKGLR